MNCCAPRIQQQTQTTVNQRIIFQEFPSIVDRFHSKFQGWGVGHRFPQDPTGFTSTNSTLDREHTTTHVVCGDPSNHWVGRVSVFGRYQEVRAKTPFFVI